MLFCSVPVSGLDAAGGWAPTCTQSPEVPAPAVPLGQDVQVSRQLGHRKGAGWGPCLPRAVGSPGPASSGEAPFLGVTASVPHVPCIFVLSGHQSLTASSARCACSQPGLTRFIYRGMCFRTRDHGVPVCCQGVLAGPTTGLDSRPRVPTLCHLSQEPGHGCFMGATSGHRLILSSDLSSCTGGGTLWAPPAQAAAHTRRVLSQPRPHPDSYCS